MKFCFQYLNFITSPFFLQQVNGLPSAVNGIQNSLNSAAATRHHKRRQRSCSTSSDENMNDNRNGSAGSAGSNSVGNNGIDLSPSTPSTPTPPLTRRFPPGLRAPRTNPQCPTRTNWRTVASSQQQLSPQSQARQYVPGKALGFVSRCGT